MAAYEIDYCVTHDIDYFFCYKGRACHVASNGTIIPEWVDEEQNTIIQRDIYRAMDAGNYEPRDYFINEKVIKNILEKEGYNEITDKDVADYAENFRCFAKMGFDSFDSFDGKLVLICGYKGDNNDGHHYQTSNLPTIEEEIFSDGYDNRSVLTWRKCL